MTAVQQIILVVLASLGQSPSRVTPDSVRVIGHVRIHGVDCVADRVADLYQALGMGASLLPRERVLAEMGRSFPAPDLGGIDLRGAFGWLVIDDGSADLVRIPFCRLADRRSFVASLMVLSGYHWRDRVVGHLVTTVVETDEHGDRRELERNLFLSGPDGALFLLPDRGLTKLVREYAAATDLFDVSDSTAHLSIRLSLDSLWERMEPTVGSWIGLLEGAATLSRFLPGKQGGAALALRQLRSTWNLAGQCQELEFVITFEADAIRGRGALRAVPGTLLEAWLESCRPLSPRPLPFFPDDAVATLRSAGDAPLLGRLLSEAGYLDEGSLVLRLLAHSRRETALCVYPRSGAPGLLLATDCEDAQALREQFTEILSGAASRTRILGGTRDGIEWAAVQVGNWSIVSLGDRAREAAVASLAQIESATPAPAGNAPVAAELLLDVSLTGLPALLSAALGGGSHRPAPVAAGGMRLEGVVTEKVFRFDLELPVSHLKACVPSLELR